MSTPPSPTHTKCISQSRFSNSSSSSISPVLHSLHWLNTEKRMQYKIISITHNLLHSSTPCYLYHLINIQPTHPTRSSNCLRLTHPKLTSRHKFFDRYYGNASPSHWSKTAHHPSFPLHRSNSYQPSALPITCLISPTIS